MIGDPFRAGVFPALRSSELVGVRHQNASAGNHHFSGEQVIVALEARVELRQLDGRLIRLEPPPV